MTATLTRPKAVPSIHFTAPGTANYKDSDAALRFFRAYGLIPDEFQVDILREWLAVDTITGKWKHTHCGASLPRQNGKSYLLELRIIWALIFDESRVLFSSHELRSAEAIYNRIVSFFDDESRPEIQTLVKRISRTNGKQFIELKSGAICHFISRSKNAARGMTVDLIIYDESQSLDAASYSAIQPTSSATPNPQAIYVGTPPIPGVDSEIMGNFRKAAIEGTATNLTWTEYSADAGDDPDDEDLWYRVLPGLESGRISIETVRGERAMYPEEVFMRERLGTWGSTAGTSIIPMDKWASLANDMSKIESGHVLAIDLSPNRASATLAVAGFTADGKVHVEIIDSRLGVGWVTDRVLQVAEKNNIRSIVIDSLGPASTLVDPLRKAKMKVSVTTTQEMKNAAGMFLDGVNESKLTHVNQPPLNLSLANARKRKIGDGFAFARSSPTSDLTPLIAVALAAWGVSTSKVRKSKPSNKSSSKRKAVILR